MKMLADNQTTWAERGDLIEAKELIKVAVKLRTGEWLAKSSGFHGIDFTKYLVFVKKKTSATLGDQREAHRFSTQQKTGKFVRSCNVSYRGDQRKASGIAWRYKTELRYMESMLRMSSKQNIDAERGF